MGSLNKGLKFKIIMDGEEMGTYKNGGMEIEKLDPYTVKSKHYVGKFETIDYIKDKLTYDQFNGYLLGNAVKYLSRYNNKGEDIKDIKKAITYLMWLVDNKNEKDM